MEVLGGSTWSIGRYGTLYTMRGFTDPKPETSPLLRSALVKSIDARIFAALSSGLQTAFASVLLSSRDESEVSSVLSFTM